MEREGDRMSDKRDSGGPAFPGFVRNEHDQIESCWGGMTLRQYAAIKLRVPNSGTDWLDEMIEEARRDAFAAAALTGFARASLAEAGAVAIKAVSEQLGLTIGGAQARMAFDLADAMLAERAKGGGK